jgi:putative sigma-54 modulation protein
VQINISARHGHLSPATQEKISEKVDHCRKFYDRVSAIHVTVDLEHPNKPSVEVVVSAELHEDFVAREEAESLLAAVDAVIHKVEAQLRKYKEKITDRRAMGHKHVETSPPGAE